MLRRSRPVLVLAALSGLALLPGAQTTLSWSGATLGGTVTYDLAGDGGEIYGLKPSLQLGPLPLPGGVLDIGLDLINLLQVGFLSPATGMASLTLGLPSDPSFAGIPIHAQFVTFPGPGVLIDDVSNRTTFVASLPNDVQNTFTENVIGRTGHTLSRLPDGSALVGAGDEPQPGGGFVSLASLERYDPETQSFTELSVSLTAPRSTHTATTLADGRILFAGGYDGTGVVQATAEIYDPATNTVTTTGPMMQARTQHSATLLADGRVLVIGGSALFDLSQVLSSLLQSVDSTEIYDPVSNTWSAGPDIPLSGSNFGVIGQATTRMNNGQVLVTGGVKVSSFLGIPLPSFNDEAWRYDPVSNSFLSTPDMAEERVYHGSTLLPDGRVLIVGGADGDFVALSFFTRASCEVYDPNTNSFSAGPSLNHQRAYVNLVDTGDAIVSIGGLATADVSTGSGTPEQTIETLDYGLTGWVDGPQTILPREVARAVALESGDRILFVGEGLDGMSATDKTAEQFIR